MADDAKKKDTKEKAGEADASSKQKAADWIRSAVERFGIQGLNRVKGPVARLIVNRILTPEQRAKVAEHEDVVETVATLVAMIPFNLGIPEHLADDAIQGLAREVINECKKDGDDASGATTSTKPAFDEAKEIRRVMFTVAAMPDQSKRDRFNHWFTGLNSKPDQRKTFLALAASSNDAELKALVQLPVPELETLLAALPSAPQEKKPMTYLDLQAAIQKDAALQKRVQDFLDRIGADLASKFEAAVNRNLNKEIKSVDDFRAMMALSDDAIKQFLGLDKEGSATKAGKWIKQTAAKAGGKIREGDRAVQDAADASGLSETLGQVLKWSERFTQVPSKAPGKGGTP